MSLEVIEVMITESIRNGEINEEERNTIINQGQEFGISADVINTLIDEKIQKFNKEKLEKEANEARVLREKKEQEDRIAKQKEEAAREAFEK